MSKHAQAPRSCSAMHSPSCRIAQSQQRAVLLPPRQVAPDVGFFPHLPDPQVLHSHPKRPLGYRVYSIRYFGWGKGGLPLPRGGGGSGHGPCNFGRPTGFRGSRGLPTAFGGGLNGGLPAPARITGLGGLPGGRFGCGLRPAP